MNHQRPSESFIVLPGMKPKYTEDPKRPGQTRLPGCSWLPNRLRHLFISFAGEFVGTFLFLFFAFTATQVANNIRGSRPMDVGTLLYISLAFGFSLAVNVWVFFRISGGLFNPAVTVAMGLIGALGWMKVLLLILAQLIAAIAAAAVVSALYPGPLSVNTTLSSETSTTRGLFIEMFLTFLLVFTIFMLAAEKHRATFIAPVGIGLALFVAELAGVFYTGGSLNPARSFGPAVVTGVWPGHHWVYWIGPLLGAILAVVFYRLMKLLEYETANPGADNDGRETSYHGGARHHSPTRFETAQTRQATDGADEHDFATQLQSGSRQPPRIQRQATPSMNNATSTDTSYSAQPSTPIPAYLHGMDGHRSDTINHPDDRPRAHHTRSSSQYDMASDSSYRHGPSVESGSTDL